MANCMKCGAALNEGAKFCMKCGAEVSIPVIQRPEPVSFCMKCGAKMNPNAKFCMKCGNRAAGPEPEPEKSVIPEPAVVPESERPVIPEPAVVLQPVRPEWPEMPEMSEMRKPVFPAVPETSTAVPLIDEDPDTNKEDPHEDKPTEEASELTPKEIDALSMRIDSAAPARCPVGSTLANFVAVTGVLSGCVVKGDSITLCDGDMRPVGGYVVSDIKYNSDMYRCIASDGAPKTVTLTLLTGSEPDVPSFIGKTVLRF